MSLLRRKPFTLLSLLLAIILLILACITVNRACYDQPNKYSYTNFNANGDQRYANDCQSFCLGPAVKLIGTPTTEARTDQFQFPTRRVVRCPWRTTTRHLFLALTSWIVLWFFIELLLSAYFLFHFCWNIIGLLALGFAIPTAIYLIHDLQATNCSFFQQRGFLCYSTIFTICFILVICLMVAMLAMLIWNLVHRRKLFNRRAKNESVPVQNPAIITEPVIVNEAPVLAHPISGTVPPIVAADERIA